MIERYRPGFALLLLLGGSLPAFAQSPGEKALAQLIQDISKHSQTGYVLTRPEGVDPRYSKRLEDVSERRYAEEAKTLAGFDERLKAIDRAAPSSRWCTCGGMLEAVVRR